MYFPSLRRFLRRKTTKQWIFANHIKTDGFSVSILLRRRESEEDSQQQPSDGDDSTTSAMVWSMDQTKGRWRQSERWDNVELANKFKSEVVDHENWLQSNDGNANPCRIVGVDPGRRDMITVSVSTRQGGNPKKKGEFFSVSNKQYRHESKIQVAERRITVHLERQKVQMDDGRTIRIKTYLNSLPTHKVSTSLGIKSHLAYLAPVLTRWFKVHRFGNVLRARLTTHIHRDKSLTKICHRLAGKRNSKNPPVLVAFGNGACSSGFRHPNTPQARLRRRISQYSDRMHFILIHEYLSSQLCSECGHQLENVCRNVTNDQGGQEHHPIYAVKKCPCCSIFWHRDKNAARNMEKIFKSLASTGERPTKFAFKGKQTAGSTNGKRSRDDVDAPPHQQQDDDQTNKRVHVDPDAN